MFRSAIWNKEVQKLIASDGPDLKVRHRNFTSFWKLEIIHFRKLSPPPFTMGAGNWPLILKLGHNRTISKFDSAGFLIFVQVFVSRDYELGRNVRFEELTICHVRG